MAELFERIYLINLRRRADRAACMRSRLAAAQLAVPVEWVEAVDGQEIDPSYLERQGYRAYPSWELADSPNPWYSRQLKLGELGCSLSHYHSWQRAFAGGWERVLILEDDARFGADFSAECAAVAAELPADFDLLYLFRCPIGGDRGYSARLCVPGFSHL